MMIGPVIPESPLLEEKAGIVTRRSTGTRRHVVSVCRSVAGVMRSALRTRRVVDALTRKPGLSNSPWIL